MTLDEIRAEIDGIDNEIKPLFIRRMECARHVARAKAVTGGDVYVPEREAAVIEQRSFDIDPEIRKEYTTFLRHLMGISRKYEYGMLDKLQEQVVADALADAGLSADTEHGGVEIYFCCSYADGNLNSYVNMAELNQVGILGMKLEVKEGRQEITMLLQGNINDKNMKRLLCQLGKEAEDFKILRIVP